MNSDHNTKSGQSAQDPFGLAELPWLEPERDAWPAIRQALEADAASPPGWQSAGRWLALAASLVLVAGIALHQAGRWPLAVTPEASPAGNGETLARGDATQTPAEASVSNEDPVQDLIAMSQILEARLRELRRETSGMPAQSAVYVAELEDMIAQVDGALSNRPDSVDLWGQRVNLLLDLEMIFQHQWEREYGRMASL